MKICAGGATLDDPPIGQEADLVGHLAGEAHLVGGDQHRHSLLLELADDRQHLSDELGVQGAGDLVEQQRARAGHQRAGDRHPLLLAAREPVRIVLAAAGEPEALEHRQAVPARLRGVDPLGLDGAEDHVVDHAAVREQVVGLEDEAEPAPERHRVGARAR